MNKKLLPVVSILIMGLCGCTQQSNKNKKSDVVSQRYIHKYGYDVSKDEWNNNHYPGQVVTTLKNGVTIASSYEDGVLHGTTSFTYPHSQTLESLQIYERGNLIKKTSFDIKGVPHKEEIFLSPGHLKSKIWYQSGTPMSVEEKLDSSLLNGEYYTLQNELESRIENGKGIKTQRNKDGLLVCKENFEFGNCVSKESYHPNGLPDTLTYYKNGQIHGEKKSFGPAGEPLFVENYNQGKLHGISTYFQNGYKYLESPYKFGKKEGVERQFIDGETLVEETEYHAGVKHGSSTFYCDGISKSEWYYNNDFVSKAKFEELTDREKMISIMNERSKARIYEIEDDSAEYESTE
jgi:antitoxin component YwqK of YwqJK toxin-antitoxin module